MWLYNLGLYSEGGNMNFLYRNKLAEKGESSGNNNPLSGNYQFGSHLFEEIPYKLDAIVNIGFWVKDLCEDQECEEEE